MKEFSRRLVEAAGEERVKFQEPMSRHTTFRIGGPADYYVIPRTVEDLKKTVGLCREWGVAYTVLGNGSNLLVRDEGYRGAVIALGDAMGRGDVFSGCKVVASRIRAGSGVTLAALARRALEAGLTGLEFAAGIPGTLGGAVVMNAGAYGSEMREVLTEATVLDGSGEVLTIPSQDLELGYRASCIGRRGLIVLEAELQLRAGDPREIGDRMEELAGQRRLKQPLEYPSAGSTFKRPEGYFAGKLIQDAGLRGYRVGGAQVSEKHCGFVVNRGDATCDDVLQLCRDVKEKVYQRFQVELEMEVRILGD